VVSESEWGLNFSPSFFVKFLICLEKQAKEGDSPVKFLIICMEN